ncbi:29982_t:CDS:2 [Racocetra persica]|uniref:29982_t:CDS:1 n=1 Tax=Racocetra persica TaxID=160502 RepID=A0ACA9LJM3_9GLOM|nr:29982_t:CDS:2 [Racocetra persica]
MAPSPQFIVGSPINRGQGSGSSNSGNFFTRFLRDEIFAPEKRQGNLDIIVSVGVFAATIAFLQNYPDLV